MTPELLQWLADGLAILGVVIMTIAVYGMVRMPDIYTRLHAASKAVVLGILPILLAALLRGEEAIISRVIMIGIFILLTTPVSAHAIGRAAYLMELHKPNEGSESQPGWDTRTEA